ncbi:MAG: hypothetical protein IJD97_07395 [Clostridia bacterium]|nr:hypothetical protein [Clostridia bacterium]
MKISELEKRLKNHAEIVKNNMKLSRESDNIRYVNERRNKRTGNILKKTVLIAAVLMLCIVTVTMTPLAKSIKGFFSDIVRFDGAITGTKYENATEEIEVRISEVTPENGNAVVRLNLTFENPTEAPFPYIQEVSVSEYKILDSNNKEVIKARVSYEEGDKGTVSEGKVSVNLYLKDTMLKSGEEYKVIIEKMYGHSKADAPLHITGRWECEFVK